MGVILRNNGTYLTESITTLPSASAIAGWGNVASTYVIYGNGTSQQIAMSIENSCASVYALNPYMNIVAFKH
jgi:hypothetical protein